VIGLFPVKRGNSGIHLHGGSDIKGLWLLYIRLSFENTDEYFGFFFCISKWLSASLCTDETAFFGYSW